ncbi:hypothetical protein JOC74_003447 [Bacillus capparidis]|uniref:Uncharacterized protein n=1 Tax=Bacillus capparidis TaxID=1840411 RepID=A0ABS4CZY4_9BACI|nr:hypothetical protein [Bacillus capparidis]
MGNFSIEGLIVLIICIALVVMLVKMIIRSALKDK